MRKALHVALPSTAVGLLVGATHHVRSVGDRALSGFLDGGDAPGWLLPNGWTAGSAVVAYTNAAELVAFLASVVLVAGLGFWVARRVDVADAFPALVAGFTAGGLLGIPAGHLLAAGVLRALAVSPQWLSAATLVPSAGQVLQFVLVALAGVALAHFGASRPDGSILPRGRPRSVEDALVLLPVALIAIEVLGKLLVILLVAL